MFLERETGWLSEPLTGRTWEGPEIQRQVALFIDLDFGEGAAATRLIRVNLFAQ